MSIKTLLNRYDQLNPKAQDKLLTYWNQLLAQQEQDDKDDIFRMSDEYRDQIATIGVWSEDDLQPFKDAEKLWHWDAPEW